VPPLVGSVIDQVPAAAAVLSVTTPLDDPDRPREPAVVPATPSVGVAVAEIVLSAVEDNNVPAPVVARPVPPDVTASGVVSVRLDADIARPAVRLAMDTCFVVADCTIGRTSVPSTGVVAAGSWEIFTSAIYLVLRKKQRGLGTP
jgi:hypothetical protein